MRRHIALQTRGRGNCGAYPALMQSEVKPRCLVFGESHPITNSNTANTLDQVLQNPMEQQLIFLSRWMMPIGHSIYQIYPNLNELLYLPSTTNFIREYSERPNLKPIRVIIKVPNTSRISGNRTQYPHVSS